MLVRSAVVVPSPPSAISSVVLYKTRWFCRHSVMGCILLFIFACILSIGAHGQSTQFQGRVTDPLKAVVVGADVRIVNKTTNMEHRVKTNKDGLYSVPFVRPGTYQISVQAPGFSTAVSTPLVLTVGQSLTFDVQLKVGGVHEDVTVQGESSLLNTTDGSVSTVIDRRFVENTPLDGRSFQDLITLTPGVITQTPQQGVNSAAGHGDFSVNGQRTEENAYIVDGVSANTGPGTNGAYPTGHPNPGTGGNQPAGTALGTTQSLLSVDALQEFRVDSSSYSAEYGQFPGGQLIFNTRSGTNQFHGSAADYLRNNFTDANNWVSDYLGVKQTPLRMNDFGGTLGGPVIIPKLYNGRDRTFFFVSYEGLRSVQPQPATISYVPSLSIRQNASSYLQQFLNAFPRPTGAEQTVACVAAASPTQTPCPAGVAGGTQVPSGLALYNKSYSYPSSFDSTSVRIDQTILSKMNVFFRYGYTPSQVNSRIESQLTSLQYNNVNYTVGATNQFSNSLANSFRLNYAKSVGSYIETNDTFDGAAPLSLASAMGAAGYPYPLVSFSDNVTGVGSTGIANENLNNHLNQWNLVDTLSKVLGHHQLKLGFNYLRVESPLNPYNPDITAYFYNTDQLKTNTVERLALFTRVPSDPVFSYFGTFIQDEWRLAPRLSLSLGLRWQVDPPPTNVSGTAPFNVQGSLANPSSLALGSRNGALYSTTYFNFAPRLGVAWQAHRNPGWETVARTGGGVFFDSNAEAVSGFYASGPGLNGSGTYSNVSLPATPVQIAASSPTTSTPYSGLFFTPHLQLPYTLQWNVSVQQSLGKPQAFTISYVGANGRRLYAAQQFTPGAANTKFSSLYYIPGNVTSSYNALQLEFQRTLTHGVQALASYTWSHSIDLGSVNAQQQIPLTRGNSDFDLRNNFQAALSWDLPNVKGNWIAQQALSHWAMDGRFIARSAFPVNIFGNILTDPVTGGQYYSGAILNSGVPLYIYGTACTAYYVAHGNGNSGRSCPGGRAINPAAFSLPSGNNVGDAPRNYARGFGQNQINFAVRREFPILEGTRLQFRAEAFNILNHPVFGAINSTVGNATFGEAQNTLSSAIGQLSSLYQTGGPRSMQFMLKVMF